MSRGSVFAVDGDLVQVVDADGVRDLTAAQAGAAGLAVPHVEAPGGRATARIATISDLHIGESGFGVLPRVRERHGRQHEPYTVRAARAAVAEAVEWGAQALVVKGDLTWSARPKQWERVASILAGAGVPVLVVTGNHDVSESGQEGRPYLEEAGVALIVDRSQPVGFFDVAGARIVLAATATPQDRVSALYDRDRDRLLEVVDQAPAGSGAIVMTHHYPDRFAVPTRYPRGLPRAHAAPLLHEMARLHRPPGLLTCGHSHRNRRYQRSGIEVTEVGSTKDAPGVWAGYVIHEGGYRQVVRRISEPSVVEWIDRTARSCLGLWGMWTTGLLPWRCFSRAWGPNPR